MRHVDDSRSGQHVGNRDYTPRSEYFAVAGGGARTADAKQARRILAFAMVLDAHARLLAAQAGAMDRRTPRDRGHRYNADGLGGWLGRMAWPGWWTGPGLGVGLVRPKPGGAKWRSGEVGGRRP